MSSIWKILQEQTSLLREYLGGLDITADKKKYAYFISREEIERLLDQPGTGQRLDGLRIYQGGEPDKNGSILPTVHILACIKNDQGGYDDYQLTEMIPEEGTPEYRKLPLLGKTYPCPPHCSKKNFLNKGS